MHAENDTDDRLTALIVRLQKDFDTAGLSYRTLRERAQGAAIPAYQGADHIWRFRESDVPAIAAALRLRKRPAPAPTRRQSAQSVSA